MYWYTENLVLKTKRQKQKQNPNTWCRSLLTFFHLNGRSLHFTNEKNTTQIKHDGTSLGSQHSRLGQGLAKSFRAFTALFFKLKNKNKDWQDCLMGKSSCCVAWWPKLDPEDSHGGTRETIPASCPLTFVLTRILYVDQDCLPLLQAQLYSSLFLFVLGGHITVAMHPMACMYAASFVHLVLFFPSGH